MATFVITWKEIDNREAPLSFFLHTKTIPSLSSLYPPTTTPPPNNSSMDNSAASTTLNRRNSAPTAVIIPPQRKLSVELISLLPTGIGSYTSLKDLILAPSPSSVLSPATPAVPLSSSPSTGSAYEISIRNRLVKQAAWAYLQSAVASSPSSTRRFCFSTDFFRSVFAGFRHFLIHSMTRVYDWLVDALWLLLCR